MEHKKFFDVMKRKKGVFSLISILAVFVGAYFAGNLYEMLHRDGFYKKSFIQNCLLGIQNYFIVFFLLFFAVFFLLSYLVVLIDKSKKVEDDRNLTISEKDDFGSSRFMSEGEEAEVFTIGSVNETKGIILGTTKKVSHESVKIPVDDIHVVTANPKELPNTHTFVLGDSGSRKTSSFIIPAVFQIMNRGESAIINDPKGDVFAETYEIAKKLGYFVRVVNTKQDQVFSSNSINFLKYAQGSTLKCQGIATVTMLNTASHIVGGFFDDNGENLLTALIEYVQYNEEYTEDEKNLVTVYRLAAEGDKRLAARFLALPADHPAKLAGMGFANQEPKPRGAAVQQVVIRLRSLQAKEVQDILVADEIDLIKPGTDKCIYYLITDDQNSSLDFIPALFLNLSCSELVAVADKKISQRLDRVVNLVLDEASQVRIVDLHKKATMLRSRGINLIMVAQDLGLWKAVYPDTWSTIISSCAIKIVLGSEDMVYTLPYLEQLLGVATIDKTDQTEHKNRLIESRQFLGYSERSGTSRRNLMNADEIRTMSLDQQLIIINSRRPAIYYKYWCILHPLYKQYHKEVNASQYIPEWRAKQTGACVINDVIEKGGEDSHDTTERQVEKKAVYQTSKAVGYFKGKVNVLLRDEEKAEEEKTMFSETEQNRIKSDMTITEVWKKKEDDKKESDDLVKPKNYFHGKSSYGYYPTGFPLGEDYPDLQGKADAFSEEMDPEERDIDVKPLEGKEYLPSQKRKKKYNLEDF